MEEKIYEKIHNEYDRKYWDLISAIWNDKREKEIGITNQRYVLCVYFNKPSYDIGMFYDRLIDFIKNSNKKIAYTWAKQWGKVRISLSPDNLDGFTFVQNDSSEKLKYQPLFTSTKRFPSSMMYDSRKQLDNYLYYITLNDCHPVTMEGAYIQLIRMVDELIWTTFLKLKKSIEGTPEEIYSMAVDSIANANVNLSYAAEKAILNKNLESQKDIIRLYGDIHNIQTVPWVIGILSTCEIYTGIPYIHKKVYDTKYKTIFLASYTVGKRPHVGHLFLLSRIKSLARFLEPEVEVILEMNDTGERFENLVELAVSELNISQNTLIARLKAGEYSIEQIEKWYTARKTGKKLYMTSFHDKIDLSLRQQAAMIFYTMEPIFGGVEHYFLLSSELDSEELLRYSDREWQHTGFEVIGNKILRRNGKPTALLARMNFMNEIIETRTGNFVYVDSSIAIKTAVMLMKKIKGSNINAIPGAGLGINFSIHNGTSSKEDLLLTSLYNWYQGTFKCSLDFLVDDINCLTCFMPIHIPMKKNDEGYYNFKSISYLKEVIMEAHQYRIDSISRLQQAEMLLPIANKTSFKKQLPKYIRKTVEYALKKFLKRALRLLKKDTILVKSYYASLDEQPINIDTAYKRYEDKNNNSYERLYMYLRQCVIDGQKIESETLKVLIREGYHSKEELIEAFNQLLEQRMELKLQLTYSQLIFNNLMKIINYVSALSQEDAPLFFEVRDLYLSYLLNIER